MGVSRARIPRAVGELWVFARSRVPLVQRLSGEQDVKPSFTAGLQYQLF